MINKQGVKEEIIRVKMTMSTGPDRVGNMLQNVCAPVGSFQHCLHEGVLNIFAICPIPKTVAFRLIRMQTYCMDFCCDEIF